MHGVRSGSATWGGAMPAPSSQRVLTRLAWGAAAGVAMSVAWRAYEHYAAGDSGQQVDWSQVRGLARAGCRFKVRAGQAAEYAALTQQYRQIASDVVGPLLAYVEDEHTELPLERLRVIDPLDWIDFNVENFRAIFDPLDQALQDRFALKGMVLAPIGRRINSSLLGTVLGYLATRVLGQYDPSLLGREAVSTGRLYLVEPNIARVGSELGLPLDQFRRWIVLHELTHAWQFEAHAWLRQHLNALLKEFVSISVSSLASIDLSALPKLFRPDGQGPQAKHWIERLLDGRQRQLFQQLQALMCVVEGYGNHVMDGVGARLLPDYWRVKERFEHRQTRKGLAERLLIKLSGIDIKLEQYKAGEAFCDWVVRERGVETMNLVWSDAGRLPTLDEIYHPQQWLARAEAAQAASHGGPDGAGPSGV